MATVVDGDFEWDDEKAASNINKHGVSFIEAMTAFTDLNAYLADDGSGTGTFVLIGFSLGARLLTVVHAEQEGDRIRLISAWPANPEERRRYGAEE